MSICFRREFEMTDCARRVATSWWAGKKPYCVIGTEVVGPDAIADLVAGRLDRKALQRRQAAGIKPLTDLLALRGVLKARPRPVSVSELADSCCVTTSGMQRAISVALENRALTRIGRGIYRANPEWAPLLKRSVAVELKLRSCTRAFEQAEAYTCWATMSWVILGQTPSESAITAARERGIGLGSLDRHGRMQRWVSPRSLGKVGPAWASAWVGEQLAAQANDF